MKPFIPHPLGMRGDDEQPHRPAISVMTTAPPAPHTTTCGDLGGSVCRSLWERSHLASDLVTASSPRWLGWAVSEILSFRIPRTQCYLAPLLTGGGTWSHGRGLHPLPMVFGGDDCFPMWPDGAGCDDPDHTTLPEHEELAPKRRVIIEEVLLDNFDDLGWPAIRAPGGAA